MQTGTIIPMTETFDLVFLCAGRGVRVGLEVPKQYVDLCGKPVMIHSLEVFEQIPSVGLKIIVHEPGESARITRLLEKYKISNWIMTPGGSTRQESVRRGLALATTPRVITHNAAVPFITPAMIKQVTSIDADCVTTASEVQDNMVRADQGSLLSVPRKGLQVVNSPQTFRADVLRHAHDRADLEGKQFNSDAELMLNYGHVPHLVPGPAWSFKITDRVDLALAETILTRPDLFPELHHDHAPQIHRSQVSSVAV